MMDGVIVEKIPVNRFLKRKVKFWFGMYVWQNISEKHGVAYEEFGTIDDEEFICDVLFYAAEYGAMKDKRFRISLNKIKQSYELMPQKQLQRIVDCMIKSRIGGDTIMGHFKDKGKKKQPAEK